MKKYKYSRITVGLLSLSGLSLGLVLAGAFGPGIAKADDKIHAGQFCVAVNSNDRSVTALYEADQVTMRNASNPNNLAAMFVCPLVRDETHDDLDNVWVRLYNANTGVGDNPINCCIHSWDDVGQMEEVECKDAPNGATGPVLLALTDLNFVDNDDGYHVLTCELEVGDGIRSIKTDE